MKRCCYRTRLSRMMEKDKMNEDCRIRYHKYEMPRGGKTFHQCCVREAKNDY